MTCPFYGCALVAPPLLPADLIRTGGNRCALITSAHSPCWMEVAELRAPEWAACPRNPEWAAMCAAFGGTADETRIIDHATDLVRAVRGAV